MAEVTARVGFSTFIAAAERNGLPVGFLLAKRVFGYQPPPGRFWSNEQVETTKVIFNAMKDFCDRVLLENKISDQFQRQPALMELWGKLEEKFPELR